MITSSALLDRGVDATMQICSIWNDGWQLDLYLYSKCKYIAPAIPFKTHKL